MTSNGNILSPNAILTSKGNLLTGPNGAMGILAHGGAIVASDGTIMTPVSFSTTQNQTYRSANEADSSASAQEAYSSAVMRNSDYEKSGEDSRDMQYVSCAV